MARVSSRSRHFHQKAWTLWIEHWLASHGSTPRNHKFHHHWFHALQRNLPEIEKKKKRVNITDESTNKEEHVTLTGLSPSWMATLIESMTRSSPFRRVMNSNFAGTRVSKLMLTKLTPHSFSFGSFFARVIPFVVIANVFNPSMSDNLKHISSRSFLIVGSPPVNLILSTPAPTNIAPRRIISSCDRSSGLGVRSTPSAGIQYWHLRLQRSVNDILK